MYNEILDLYQLINEKLTAITGMLVIITIISIIRIIPFIIKMLNKEDTKNNNSDEGAK